MDQSLKGYKQMLRDDAEGARSDSGRIIKNTYRTLMSRGMKGCYVHCTDQETAPNLERRLLTIVPNAAQWLIAVLPIRIRPTRHQ